MPEILAKVAAGDEATLTRHGQAVAVIVRPDRVHVRRPSAAAAIAQGKALESMVEVPGVGAEEELPQLDPAWAEELIAEIRSDRDAG